MVTVTKGIWGYLMNQDREAHPWVAEGAHRVRFAVHSIFVESEAQTVKAAQRAERLNFDAYWAHDHPTRLMDCWGQLLMLAMATESLRLISLVSCIYYRNPHLLARQAADVDRVSGGRLVLGLGIGDDVPEFDQMCIPFPDFRSRVRGFAAALRRCGAALRVGSSGPTSPRW